MRNDGLTWETVAHKMVMMTRGVILRRRVVEKTREKKIPNFFIDIISVKISILWGNLLTRNF